MSKIKDEVIKILNVMENSVNLNTIEGKEDEIKEINKIKDYINNLKEENDKED